MTLRTRLLALAGLALMAFGQDAGATNVLSFGKSDVNPVGTVVLDETGGVTTITTAGDSGSAPITVTLYVVDPIHGPPPTPFEAFLTIDAVSTGTYNGVSQTYSGTVEITSGAGGTGTNYLTATFTDGTVLGVAGALNLVLGASAPDAGSAGNVIYTSDFLAFMPSGIPRDFSITVGELASGLAISSGSVGDNVGRNFGGQFNATPVAIPEPSTLALAGMGAAGLLGVARRRRRV
jgi:hypothetical protein